jgi:squalene-hopene/tetraprenyl-beta-curcumene cyclase
MDAAHVQDAQKLINGGLKYLLANREADGAWSLGKGVHKPAATALVVRALMGHGDFTMDSQVIKDGYKVLLSYRQKDGGIYDPKQGVGTYTTAIAIMALTASGNPKYRGVIDDAVKYLKDVQIQPGSESPDGTTVKDGDPRIGGVDYGNSGQPNLSVLGFVVESWKDAGVKSDDPAMKSAVEFLKKVQNRSESNPTDMAREGSNDNGFFYALSGSHGGAGQDGKGQRSYGSMTYVGFKSLLYAGVDRTDDRVKGALGWIRSNWRLDANPNLPQAKSQEGLYYYYLAYAKALRAYGEPVITDSDSKKHNWREELVDTLKQRVSQDGSWTNRADRWEEGSSLLVTAYAVTALEETLKK